MDGLIDLLTYSRLFSLYLISSKNSKARNENQNFLHLLEINERSNRSIILETRV